MNLNVVSSLFLLGLITVWAPKPSGFLFFTDFEQTGCTNEGTPVKLNVQTGSPNCDLAPSNCLSGECAYFAGGGVVQTDPFLSTVEDRYCIEVKNALWVGGGRSTNFDALLLPTDVLGFNLYPIVTGSLPSTFQLRLDCDSSNVSSEITNGLTGSTWKSLYVDFTASLGKGCLISAPVSDYQSGESVCCDGDPAGIPARLKFGDLSFGFAADTRMDDVKIYNGPCQVAPLVEDFTPHPDSGSNTNTIVLNTPLPTESGDLLIAIFGQSSASNCTFTPPTSWTQIGSVSSGTIRGSTTAYYHVVTIPGTSSYTWTSSCSRRVVGVMYRIAARTFDNSSAGAWLIDWQGNGEWYQQAENSSNIVCSSLSNLPPRTRVIRAAFWESGGTNSVSADWSSGTESYEEFTTSGSANIMIHGTEESEVDGSVPSNTSDPVGATSYDGHCWTIPIKPAA